MQRHLGHFGFFHWIRHARDGIILVTILSVVLCTGTLVERCGDRMQVVLPVLGLGCTVVTGGTGRYLARFAAMEAVVQGSKWELGDRPINRRPNGGLRGFPSGHTAAASFGASALVHDCIRSSAPVKAVVLIAAGFTGASRIEAGKHDIWQVLAGVLTGWLSERLLRGGVRRAHEGVRRRHATGQARRTGR